jgi:N utilization substance protein B
VGSRRSGRILALNVLFQIDVGGIEPATALRYALAETDEDGEVREFAEQLARRCLEHQAEIDRIVEELAEGWTLDRMASVDRNVLRMAACEMLYFDDIPISVSINEAVDLAKEYSTEESGKFINGILGSLGRQLQEEAEQRAASSPSPRPDGSPSADTRTVP